MDIVITDIIQDTGPKQELSWKIRLVPNYLTYSKHAVNYVSYANLSSTWRYYSVIT